MKLLPVFALKMGGAALPKMIGSQCVLCQGFQSSMQVPNLACPPPTVLLQGGGGLEEGEVQTGTVWFLLPQDCSL